VINLKKLIMPRDAKIVQYNSIILIYMIFFLGVDIHAQDMFFYGNSRPSADAGEDISVESGESVYFDGSRSFVGDESKIKYHWTFSPGLVLESENNLSSELSIQTYGGTYLKSVETYKKVLPIKLADNDPGTKLEVVLKIRDRIGFEDMDTLIVEYSELVNINQSLVSKPKNTAIDTIAFPSNFDMNYDSLSGFLIQGFVNDIITQVDAQIINSIIMDQIISIGFDYRLIVHKDLDLDKISKEYRRDCSSDQCIAYNARILNAKYVISWNFAQAADEFSIRTYETINKGNIIDEAIISRPYKMMSEDGVFGIEQSLRQRVSKILGSKIFKKDISMLDRFVMKNKKLISYGKYPIMIGAAYLLVDKIFINDPEDPDLEMPPGFPHEP